MQMSYESLIQKQEVKKKLAESGNKQIQPKIGDIMQKLIKHISTFALERKSKANLRENNCEYIFFFA